jgi:hypothetical protein
VHANSEKSAELKPRGGRGARGGRRESGSGAARTGRVPPAGCERRPRGRRASLVRLGLGHRRQLIQKLPFQLEHYTHRCVGEAAARGNNGRPRASGPAIALEWSRWDDQSRTPQGAAGSRPARGPMTARATARRRTARPGRPGGTRRTARGRAPSRRARARAAPARAAAGGAAEGDRARARRLCARPRRRRRRRRGARGAPRARAARRRAVRAGGFRGAAGAEPRDGAAGAVCVRAGGGARAWGHRGGAARAQRGAAHAAVPHRMRAPRRFPLMPALTAARGPPPATLPHPAQASSLVLMKASLLSLATPAVLTALHQAAAVAGLVAAASFGLLEEHLAVTALTVRGASVQAAIGGVQVGAPRGRQGQGAGWCAAAVLLGWSLADSSLRPSLPSPHPHRPHHRAAAAYPHGDAALWKVRGRRARGRPIGPAACMGRCARGPYLPCSPHEPLPHSVFMLLCWMAVVPSLLAMLLEALLQRKRHSQQALALLGVSLFGAGAARGAWSTGAGPGTGAVCQPGRAPASPRPPAPAAQPTNTSPPQQPAPSSPGAQSWSICRTTTGALCHCSWSCSGPPARQQSLPGACCAWTRPPAAASPVR